MLGAFAIAAAIAAFVSGLVVVGARDRWTYTVADLLRLRYDALLYLAVTFTTIWSVCHVVMIAEYLASGRSAAISAAHFAAWMLLHASISAFLVGLHVYVGVALRRPATVARLRGYLLGA